MKYLWLSLMPLMFISSCSKKIEGCTDPTAKNYDPRATKDNGSCAFIPFQGPINPNFEDGYDGWKFVQGQNGYAAFQTGVGFMPTSGYKYLNLNCQSSNNFFSSQITMYQENVNFMHTDSLIFDYEYNAHSADSTYNPQIFVAFEMFFTGNGTDTLWSKYFASNASATEQKKNFSVGLPASAKTNGKLTVRVSSGGGGGTLDLDNFRIK